MYSNKLSRGKKSYIVIVMKSYIVLFMMKQFSLQVIYKPGRAN